MPLEVFETKMNRRSGFWIVRLKKSYLRSIGNRDGEPWPLLGLRAQAMRFASWTEAERMAHRLRLKPFELENVKKPIVRVWKRWFVHVGEGVLLGAEGSYHVGPMGPDLAKFDTWSAANETAAAMGLFEYSLAITEV